MLKAVIFDMDGTLIDSESLWSGVNRLLVESYGKTYEPEFRRQLIGHGSDIPQLICEHYQLSVSPEEVRERTLSIYMATVEKEPPAQIPGAGALLSSLIEKEIPLALATASTPDLAANTLHWHSWQDHFQAVVTGDDVEKGKPEPDIFLEAARRLGVEPEHCLVFEDSLLGVQSAKAAGMKVVAINTEEITEADHTRPSFEGLTIEHLHKFF